MSTRSKAGERLERETIYKAINGTHHLRGTKKSRTGLLFGYERECLSVCVEKGGKGSKG